MPVFNSVLSGKASFAAMVVGRLDSGSGWVHPLVVPDQCGIFREAGERSDPSSEKRSPSYPTVAFAPMAAIHRI
jgi:hypothetical protein